jgi:peptide/nickel transport system permease protein
VRRFSLAILLIIHLAVLAGDFLAPHAPRTMHDQYGFHPPMLTRVHWRDEAGRWTRPFVYGIAVTQASLKGYEGYAEDRARTFPLRCFVRGEPYRVLGLWSSDLHLFGVDAPGVFFLLGSDQFGRDVWARLLAGGRTSLAVALGAVLLSALLGWALGGAAGYAGGRLDFILMRLIELLLAVPSLYLLLIARQSFGDELSAWQVNLLLAALLALTGWATQARVVRGLVLSLKEREFVLAARAVGASDARVLFRHILPHTLPTVLVAATASLPYFIFAEVALSFLGLGVQEPAASWGNLLTVAQNIRYLVDFPWLLWPGAPLFLVVLAWQRLSEVWERAQ